MVLTLGTEVPSTPADGLVNTIWVPSIKTSRSRPLQRSTPEPT